MPEREVVEHAAVDEEGVSRAFLRQLVGAEEFPLDLCEVIGIFRPDLARKLGQADRWEGAWKARGRPGGEGQGEVVGRAGEVVLAVSRWSRWNCKTCRWVRSLITRWRSPSATRLLIGR